MTPVDFPPNIPLGDWFEAGNQWLKSNFSWFFDALGAFIRWSVSNLSGFFIEPGAGQASGRTQLQFETLDIPLLATELDPLGESVRQ